MVRHVTKKEAAAVVAYAGDVAAALRMPGWEIVLMSDPCDEGRSAEIQRVQGRWSARLWLSASWMTYAEDDRRDTITHEVCHLLHAGVSTVVIDDSEHLMHEHEHDDWIRRVNRELELMVDHLARFLADTHTLKASWDIAHGRQPESSGRRR